MSMFSIPLFSVTCRVNRNFLEPELSNVFVVTAPHPTFPLEITHTMLQSSLLSIQKQTTP